jgi:sulfate adenylyltransferase large subunit
VDDGKSTLIGRLLYESNGIYEDQLSSVRKASVAKNVELDLSLLTDGLRAEREQGITIDVAYRYFSTPRRKFIIADAPGHEQYTRNMATGASTADLAVILVDARKGVLPQTRRHSLIAWLMGIRQMIVAINKMDLVKFDQATFLSIRDQFLEFARTLDRTTYQFVPISALEGDNVIRSSTRMPWYEGNSLLHLLETLPVSGVRNGLLRRGNAPRLRRSCCTIRRCSMRSLASLSCLPPSITSTWDAAICWLPPSLRQCFRPKYEPIWYGFLILHCTRTPATSSSTRRRCSAARSAV